MSLMDRRWCDSSTQRWNRPHLLKQHIPWVTCPPHRYISFRQQQKRGEGGGCDGVMKVQASFPGWAEQGLGTACHMPTCGQSRDWLQPVTCQPFCGQSRDWLQPVTCQLVVRAGTGYSLLHANLWSEQGPVTACYMPACLWSEQGLVTACYMPTCGQSRDWLQPVKCQPVVRSGTGYSLLHASLSVVRAGAGNSLLHANLSGLSIGLLQPVTCQPVCGQSKGWLQACYMPAWVVRAGAGSSLLHANLWSEQGLVTAC